jgi:hypothetical protein
MLKTPFVVLRVVTSKCVSGCVSLVNEDFTLADAIISLTIAWVIVLIVNATITTLNVTL